MRASQLTFVFDAGRAGSRAGPEATPPLILLARNHLARLGLHRLAREVQVHWNKKMRSTAGRATWPDALVELNPALLRIGNGEIVRTLLHELAHLVAYERAGRRRIQPHGPEWRRACEELGIPGESASHRLDLPARTKRRKWIYTCPQCGVQVGRVRRMARFSACWPCCRRFAGGQYDERFRFVEFRVSPPDDSA